MRRAADHSASRSGLPRRSAGGFTIVELLVVLAVVGLLASLALPAITRTRRTARKIDCTNRLRNITVAMMNVVGTKGRFPACGNFTDKPPFETRQNWVVDVLPWLEQGNVAKQWDHEASISSTQNLPLTRLYLPVLVCPADISVEPGEDGESFGNLSYVVNSGVGYTTFYNGIHDCPVDLTGQPLDLDGDGLGCPPSGGNSPDKEIFKRLGLFFNETWKGGVSERYHTAATVTDGLSNTVILTENVRTGYNPASSGNPWTSGWASPNSQLTSFYIGDPCLNGDCAGSPPDYQRSNSGAARINSGLLLPEGQSPIPNSFHDGGVNMSFGDARVVFVSESIAGVVYAALVSPQGGMLSGTPLEQPASVGGLD